MKNYFNAGKPKFNVIKFTNLTKIQFQLNRKTRTLRLMKLINYQTDSVVITIVTHRGHLPKKDNFVDLTKARTSDVAMNNVKF